MADEEDKDSKTEQPSQKKIDDARSKGDVAKSQDLTTFASLAAATATVVIGGGWMARSMSDALIPFIAHPDAIDLSGEGAVGVMRASLRAALPAMWVMIAALVAGVAANLLQSGLMFTPSKLAPDFSKLDIIKGLGRMFGLDSLMNFLKSLAKLGAVIWICWIVLRPRWESLKSLPALDPAAILPYSAEILRSLVIAVLLAMAVIAAFDWFWMRQRYMDRMKMSREEMKQEHKDSDGDPHVKGKQRQLRMTRARQRMMQNVPKATVVVMNPTHYAVALLYEQGETAAPVCVAKGVDRVALKIREIAEAAGVHVIEDPPLARALYAAIDVDEAIPREHYQAVAKIIGFVMGAGAEKPRRAPPIRP